MTTIRGQPQVVMLDTAVDGSKSSQEPAPGVMAMLQNLFAMLIGDSPQLIAKRGDRVVLVIHLRAEQEQSPLLGGEQENQPHHHGQRRFIKHGFRNVGQELTVAVPVCLIQRLDQRLHRAPNLIAEFVGDFLLILCTLRKQRFQCLILSNPKKAPSRKKAPKGLKSYLFLQPESGVPRHIARRLTTRRIDQHPSLAIGHQTQRNICRVKELHHSSRWKRLPPSAFDGLLQILLLRISLNQKTGFASIRQPFGCDCRKIGTQDLMMLGYASFQPRRNRLPFKQDFMIEFKRFTEYKPNPRLMDGRIWAF